MLRVLNGTRERQGALMVATAAAVAECEIGLVDAGEMREATASQPDALTRAQDALIDLGQQIAMRWEPDTETDRETLAATIGKLADAINLGLVPREVAGLSAMDQPTVVLPVAAVRRSPRVVIEAMGCE